MNKFFLYLFYICCVSVLFSCQKEYSFEKGNILPAAGSLWDSVGNCLPDSVHGTFYTGIIPGQDTAYVEIQVNVTQTGSYSIKTDQPEDGLEFMDSGFFSNTGINVIRLKPIGTPIINTAAIFTIQFDSTVCSFTVNVLDSTGTGLGGHDSTGTGSGSGNWQFATDSGGNFQGTFSIALAVPDTTFGGTDLGMTGFTPSGDTAFTLAIIFPGAIQPGTYHTKILNGDTHANAVFAFAFAAGAGDAIYDAFEGQTAPSDVTVTVASYDASTHLITGTFSGPAANETTTDDNDTIGISNGSFTATVFQ